MAQSPKIPWSGVAAAGVAHVDDEAPPPVDPPPSGLTSHTQEMAERLRRKVGVQNFTNADGRVYGHHQDVIDRIVGMGCGYMRGMLLGNNGDNEFAQYCRDNNIGWLMTTTPEAGISDTALQAKIRHLAANNADVCIGVEGMNEPNQDRSGKPMPDNWPETTTASFQVLYNAMKASSATADIPIFLPSLHDTQSANSYVSQRSLVWTRQTTALAYGNSRWTAATPTAGTALMTSGYIAPSASQPNAWASTPFGGYTDIRGTGVKLVLEAWSATARLKDLGSLTLTGANNATIKDFPIQTTPAGTTRLRVRAEAVGGADAVLLLGGTTTSTTTHTNTYTLGLAPKPDGGFRQFHQLAAAGAGEYADYAGMHRYTSGQPISANWSGKGGRSENLKDAFPDLPLWLTEIGWQDAMDLPTGSGFRPTPPDIGAEYGGRAIVFACGVNDTPVSYFELLDDPDLSGRSVQAHFGMYEVGVGVATTPSTTYDQRVIDANPDDTWAAKPVADEWERILTWLEDQGHETDPAGVAYYDVRVGNSTLIYTHPVKFSSAHPTRAGETWLMYFRDTNRYNASQRTVIADAPQNFTLVDGQGSRTISAAGKVAWVKIRPATTTPPPPATTVNPVTNLAVSGTPTSDGGTVTWTQSTTTGTTNNVYVDGGTTPVANVSGASYTFTGLTAGTAHTVVVKALKSGVESAAATVTLTTAAAPAPPPATAAFTAAPADSSFNVTDGYSTTFAWAGYPTGTRYFTRLDNQPWSGVPSTTASKAVTISGVDYSDAAVHTFHVQPMYPDNTFGPLLKHDWRLTPHGTFANSGTVKNLCIRVQWSGASLVQGTTAQNNALLDAFAAAFTEYSRGALTMAYTFTNVLTISPAPTDTQEAIVTAAYNAAVAAGVAVSSYDRLLVFAPQTLAGGAAAMDPALTGSIPSVYLPGVLDPTNARALHPLVHELGHHIGWKHDNSLETPLTTTALAGNSSEYGDSGSLMGGPVDGLVVRHPSAPHKNQRGWITVRNVTENGTYSLSSVEQLTPANPHMLAIHVPGKQRFYYVSMRQAVGHDAVLGDTAFINSFGVFTSGLMIHVRTTSSLIVSAYAVLDFDSADTNPPTKEWGLKPGATFTDPDSGTLTIKCVSKAADSASVEVGGLPANPGVVTA